MEMVIIAHPDDEGIWFGGLLPYLSIVKNKKIILIVMCCSNNHIRAKEIENACKIYGKDIEIIFGNFKDQNIRFKNNDKTVLDIDNNFRIWGSKDNVVNWLVLQIEKYKPENIYTHDLEGEGYHSNHKCTSIAVENAVEKSMHKIEKLYFHLLDENIIFFDWSIKVEDKTLLDISNKALSCHISQHQPNVRNNSHIWGFKQIKKGF